MNNAPLINLALSTLECNQKQLAEKLAVSATQISKWKRDEYMSLDMEQKLKELIGLDYKDESNAISVVYGIENYKKWKTLTSYIFSLTESINDTGYDLTSFNEDDLLSNDIIVQMARVGIRFPREFPEELDVAITMAHLQNGEANNLDYDFEDFSAILHGNAYTNLIQKVLTIFNDYAGFYLAYIYDVCNESLELDLNEIGDEIEAQLLPLSLCIAMNKTSTFTLLSKSESNCCEINARHEISSKIRDLQIAMCRNNIPFEIDIMQIAYKDHDPLGAMAERKSLGYGKENVHPDCYMNELVESQRMIHTILPMICEKLGISKEDILAEYRKNTN